MKQNIFVFDVESTSLHGEGFAVGAVVADRETGHIIDKFELLSEEGEKKVNDWVKENIVPHLQSMDVCETSRELRDKFYEFYMKWKDTCDIYSDVNFPVETNFLSAIVADDPSGREWNMPYPLLDIANVVDVNIDRSKESGAKLTIKHHPTYDAADSLKCLLNILNRKKRLFEVLDDMNMKDCKEGTRLVSIGNHFISGDKVKAGAKICMGTTEEVLMGIFTESSIPILVTVDKKEYFERTKE